MKLKITLEIDAPPKGGDYNSALFKACDDALRDQHSKHNLPHLIERAEMSKEGSEIKAAAEVFLKEYPLQTGSFQKSSVFNTSMVRRAFKRIVEG